MIWLFMALFTVTLLGSLGSLLPLRESPKRTRRLGRLILSVLVPVLGGLVFHFAMLDLQGRPTNWWALLPVGLALVLAAWFGFRPIRERDLRVMYLLRPRYCPQCDYDLTGNTSGRCPECGWTLPIYGSRDERPDWPIRGFAEARWKIDYLENPRRTVFYEAAKLAGVCLLAVAWLVFSIVSREGHHVFFGLVVLAPAFFHRITNVRRVIAYRDPKPSEEQEA